MSDKKVFKYIFQTNNILQIGITLAPYKGSTMLETINRAKQTLEKLKNLPILKMFFSLLSSTNACIKQNWHFGGKKNH
jgi:hypothetical protein